MIEKLVYVPLATGLCLLAACSSSETKDPASAADSGTTVVIDGAVAPGADKDAASEGDAAGGGGGGGGDSSTTAVTDPCSLGATAIGNAKVKMSGTPPETVTGGTLKSGTYRLKFWGQAKVSVAYELDLQLVLKVGETNYWNVASFYQNMAHSGGGTFTVDPATHVITFTKTCGGSNVGLDDPTKAGYIATDTEFKLVNTRQYGTTTSAMLIFYNP